MQSGWEKVGEVGAWGPQCEERERQEGKEKDRKVSSAQVHLPLHIQEEHTTFQFSFF